MSKVNVGGRDVELNQTERERYAQAESQFKAAQSRAAGLGTLATCKKRMLRELDSYRMNIRELMQGASPDLLAAIAADVEEITKAMTEVIRA